MTASKIFNFRTIGFSKKDLAIIPKYHFGFMTAASLAANDQAIFLKLYILSMRSLSDNSVLNQYTSVQSSIIQRTLIAKTYEFMRLFDRFNAQISIETDKEFAPFMKMATKRVASARNGPVWDLVKKIRNKMTNHYDIDHLDPFLTAKEFPEDYEFNIHLHNQTGNTLYIFSEELSYLSFLYEEESEGVTPYQVMNWLLKTSRTLTQLHQKYMFKLISSKLPGKLGGEQKLLVDDNCLWELGDNLPLLNVETS
ncbi:hypothetical protein [Methylobacterium sp. WL6]|uniref:hypothetical protein n=1 Tax=Methylobacterium sp. WL6 TaxID=2603901 RepID=UPI0011C740B5|nr:hypothetical protein [Methylobacterium sp. WL6]TXN68459.1 hypothetical protein FV230_12885 [Methylobacterium sp. WL6]